MFGRLRFDRNDAAQPIFQRREFARNVNIKIDRVRVGHRVALENRHVLNEKKLTADRRLQNAQIDRIARAEFFEIEFFQPIVEPLQARKLGVDRQSRVVIDLAVVLMETQSNSLERPRGQVTLDEFLGDAVEIGVAIVRERALHEALETKLRGPKGSVTIS